MIDKNPEIMKPIHPITLVVFISMVSTWTFSQDMTGTKDTVAQEPFAAEHGVKNGFDFFASDELLEITLSFDVKEFLRTKSQPENLDASLTVKLSDTDSKSQQIKVKARGEMRRTYCAFPPIMLKFKGGGKDTGRIQGKGTLKLVTHCNATASFKSNVLKEYLIYKMFNLVTPFSFKTRLVKITYIDINRPDKTFVAFGFLIENEDKMAERNHAVMIKALNATQKDMSPLDMARVAVFNYMIGNTDWTVPYQHNIRIMKSLETPVEKPIPVVYDFDYSALVNAVYATPHELLPIQDISERYYLGICNQEEVLNTVIEEFTELKDDFMGAIRNFEYLPKNEKKYVESYLNSFYKSYNQNTYLISALNRTCKHF